MSERGRIRIRVEPSIRDLAGILYGDELSEKFSAWIMEKSLRSINDRPRQLAEAMKIRDEAEDRIRLLSSEAWHGLDEIRAWFQNRGRTMAEATLDLDDRLYEKSLNDCWAYELDRRGSVPGRKRSTKIRQWMSKAGLEESVALEWFSQGFHG